MKPKINQAEKQFIAACNRVRALISFKKLETPLAVARELGLEHLVDSEFSSSPIGCGTFNSWLARIDKARRHPTVNTVTEAIGTLDFVGWKDEDSEIESKIYEGASFLLKHKSRLSAKDKWEHLVPPKDADQKAECLYFQYDCALEAFNAITVEDKRGIYIRANTGDGKTYFAGQIAEWLINSGFLDKISVSPWRMLYVTGASIVEQTIEALREFGLKVPEDIEVTNYESLRTKFGSNKFIKKHTVVEQGEEHEIWEWTKMLHPAVIFWDEGHKLKNEGSIQSKIAQACNNLNYKNPFTQEEAKVYQIFMSASPFSRIVHAKPFAVATRKRWKSKDKREVLITNGNWKSIAAAIASPADLLEYSRPAIKRFLREFKDYIFPFRNVRRKFKGVLQTEFLDFLTAEDAKDYKEAWDRYLEFKKSIEGKEYGNSKFLLLVQLNVLRQAAEKLRKHHLAKFMYEAWCKGKAPVAACAYKSTIALTLKILIEDYGVKRDDVTIIWGGSAALSGAKEETFTKEEIHYHLKNMLNPDNFDEKLVKKIHAQLTAQHDGLQDIDPSLRLGIQSRDARNIERKRFQSGKTEYCFFTFGAGKEGLSLHQNLDSLRPREQFVTPVYNEMELLQAEGRTARITSLSDTLIRTLVFRDTIEVPVLQRVLAKRHCLEVVRTHGDKLEAMSSQIEDLMKLAGFESGSEEDEEVEQEVFDQLEHEIEDEDKED